MSNSLDLDMYRSFISTVQLSRDACSLEPPFLYFWVCTSASYLTSSSLNVEVCCSLLHCPVFQAWTYTPASYIMSISVDLDGYCRLIINVTFTINMRKVSGYYTRVTVYAYTLRRRSAAARLLRLWFRILLEACVCVCCECCVLSGRGLCDELITRPHTGTQTSSTRVILIHSLICYLIY
jgi:hypothetical protein